MPTPWQRDRERDRRQLLAWLDGRIPGASDLSIESMEAPSGSGFSNDTLLLELGLRRNGRREREGLVVRIQPTGFQVFPEYDMQQQFRTLQILSTTQIPVPRPLWLETRHDEVLGAPFYVMSRVSGRAPTDNPPYHREGWMAELPESRRNEVWLAAFDCMAEIHALDWRGLGFDFLARPELGDDALTQQIAYWTDFLRWAARGLEQPVPERAFEWVRARRPDDRRRVLCWGDARIGNLLFEGTRPVAVLDWEMACLASPELDVAWQLFMDRHHSEAIGIPRLAGLADYPATLRHYHERSGAELRHIDFYRVFGGLRFAIIMIRIAQQFAEYGVMDAATARNFEIDNPATRLLARTLDEIEAGATLQT